MQRLAFSFLLGLGLFKLVEVVFAGPLRFFGAVMLLMVPMMLLDPSLTWGDMWQMILGVICGIYLLVLIGLFMSGHILIGLVAVVMAGPVLQTVQWASPTPRLVLPDPPACSSLAVIPDCWDYIEHPLPGTADFDAFRKLHPALPQYPVAPAPAAQTAPAGPNPVWAFVMHHTPLGPVVERPVFALVLFGIIIVVVGFAGYVREAGRRPSRPLQIAGARYDMTIDPYTIDLPPCPRADEVAPKRKRISQSKRRDTVLG
jgi:hypothetical protein